MANRYAVATGNWSNTAIWDGGTLPGVGDVVRPNGFTVTIDQDITVQELTDNTLAPATQGGVFLVTSSNLNINCNILKRAGASTLLTIQSGANNTSIIGDLNNTVGVFLSTALVVNSTGTTNVTGNISMNANQNGSYTIVASATSGILNYTGTMNMVSGGNLSATTFLIQGNMTVNIVGIINGGTGTASPISTLTNRSISAILTGNIIAIGGVSTPAVGNDNSNQNIVINSAVFADGVSPIRGAVRFSTTNPTVTVILSNLSTLTLSDPSTTNPPVETDVRLGTTYGGGAFIGLLAVPSPSQVSVGISTDNTVGTGIVTSNDFLEAIKTSSDPLAERLRNVATVQTVGDQFNSFS
jgi:hypothetical protein